MTTMSIVCDNAYHDRGHGVCSFCVQKRIEKAVRDRLDTPEVLDFIEAVKIEAEHQRERWKATDPIKDAADWYWLIGWLGGKAITDPHDADDTRTAQERKLHRIITVAAAAYNWHASVKAQPSEGAKTK